MRYFPTQRLIPVIFWQSVVAVLAGALYFREYSSYLSGASLCKAKTAEFEFGSDAPEVRFDTSQADFQYLCVTFRTYFVIVRTADV